MCVRGSGGVGERRGVGWIWGWVVGRRRVRSISLGFPAGQKPRTGRNSVFPISNLSQCCVLNVDSLRLLGYF